MNSSLSLAIILFSAQFAFLVQKTEGVVTVFEDINFEGESRRLLNFKMCLDFVKGWEDRVSSVNTGGACILLCEHKRCKGKCERIEPGTMRHNNLDSLSFNDIASSYMAC